MSVHPANTQISLGIRPVWSESSMSASRKLGSLATHWAHSEDSDQSQRMPRGWSESSLGTHSFCWFCHVAAQTVNAMSGLKLVFGVIVENIGFLETLRKGNILKWIIFNLKKFQEVFFFFLFFHLFFHLFSSSFFFHFFFCILALKAVNISSCGNQDSIAIYQTK